MALTNTKQTFKVKLDLFALEQRLAAILELPPSDMLSVHSTTLVLDENAIYMDVSVGEEDYVEVTGLDAPAPSPGF